MRKYIVVVLIALLALPILALADEEEKQPAKAYDELRYYRDMAPFSLYGFEWSFYDEVKYYHRRALFSFSGFEPSFEEEVADPSKFKLPMELYKVYLKAGKVVRYDVLLVKESNRLEIWSREYCCYDEEGRLSKQFVTDGDGHVHIHNIVTKRDSKGRPLRVTQTIADTDDVDWRYIYRYDNDGRIIQGAVMWPTKKLFIKILFAYDKQGDLLRIKLIEPGKKDEVYEGPMAHWIVSLSLGM